MTKESPKATVTLSGKYYLPDQKGTEEFSGIKINIPEEKAHIALSVCLGLIKRHLRKFLPKAVRLAKLRVDSIDSVSLSRAGKPVDVMDLAELMYVIEDKELRINVNEFPSILELRHVVKLYLANEDEAKAYIKANKVRYKEEKELMELNPELAAQSTTYLDPSQIAEAKKVKVQKPGKNFNKVKVQDLEAPDDEADSDATTGAELNSDEDEDVEEGSEEHRQQLLAKAIELGLKPKLNTGIAKLQTLIENHETEEDDDEL